MSFSGCVRPCRRTRSPRVFSLAKGAAERQLLGPDLPIDVYAMDETNTRVRTRDDRAPHRPKRRSRSGRDYRRAVERIPPRHGHCPAVARGGRPSGDRRLPCLRLPGHVEGDPGRHQSRAGSRRFDLRGRGRGRPRRDVARRRARRAPSALRSHEAPAGHRQHRLAALLAARLHQADDRNHDELRRRPRLPVPVLVLHHHQRARTQVALPLRRQRRADHPHELGARGQALLHHRRQFRPQQGLGDRSTTASSNCAKRTAWTSAS